MSKMKIITINTSIIILAIIGIFFVSGGRASALSASLDSSISTTVICTPSTINNIRVTDVRFNGAKIEWDTSGRSACDLYYGTSTNYTLSRSESSWLDFHYFNLTQLEPGTTYHFVIACQNICGSLMESVDKTFSTEPEKKSIIEEIIGTITPPEEETPAAPTPPGLLGKMIDSITGSGLVLLLRPWINLLAMLATILSILIPGLMNMPLISFWTWLHSLFLTGRKRYWGIIFDSESTEPIPGASVRLFNADENKHLGTQITDKEGRYGFVLDPGKYKLDVVCQNYFYPSKNIKDGYHSEIIEVKKDSVVTFDIPLDPDPKKLTNRLRGFAGLNNFIEAIRVPMLVLGTIITVCFYIKWPDIWNLVMLGLYILMWAYELMELRKSYSVGYVLKKNTKDPIELSVIRVFDAMSSKLVATKISDLKGRYLYLINPGTYNVHVSKLNFIPVELKNQKYTHAGVIKQNFNLEETKQVK